MPVRNHITRIQKADGVAKGTEEIEKRAVAETKKEDPKNAESIVQQNITSAGEVDGNGSGIKFTTKAAKEAEAVKRETQKDQPAPRVSQETQKKAEETQVKRQDIANPASSKENSDK